MERNTFIKLRNLGKTESKKKKIVTKWKKKKNVLYIYRDWFLFVNHDNRPHHNFLQW